MSSELLPVALFFDDGLLTSHLYQEVSERMHPTANIDLMLECEEDQGYTLPASTNLNSGLQLQTSRNVSMHISFSSCATQKLLCHYCQCNFLSEEHLMDHMKKSHCDNESGDEDGVDDGEWDDITQMHENPVSGDDELFDDTADVESNSEEKHEVKTDAVVPGFGKTALTPLRNGMVTGTVPDHIISAYSSPLQTSPAAVSTPHPVENGAAEPKDLKRKANDAANNPRLKLTIKRSKSSYEIQRDEHSRSLASLSPGMQMREENCEVQSDSTNEMIDVECSSPRSSPGSEKKDIHPLISAQKNNGMKFSCEQCGKVYVSKYALKRHVATHSDERPFLCPEKGCKAAFKLKSRLTDHIRYVHKRKTPRTVGRSKSLPDTGTSSLAQVLLSPAPVAGSGKPSAKTKLFKCTVPNCNREFRDGHNLASHMCLHTGYNPYKCSLCTYSTIQKTSLDWHMQTKHPKS